MNTTPPGVDVDSHFLLPTSYLSEPDPPSLDELVRQTADYFYEREEIILKASDEELLR
ncbi:MAG: hypothetical protein NTX88_12595 [Candidatus Atribacteria bacterium]|nr:hypothetical protein [Candidatus Atribacteria bacterium]